MEKISSFTKLATLCRLLSVKRQLIRRIQTGSCHQGLNKNPRDLQKICLASQYRTEQYGPSFSQPYLQLHTSDQRHSSKLKNRKNKVLKPVTFKPKTNKDVVSVHYNMTVGELAEAMGKDIDHVFEVMLYVPQSDRYDEPDVPIDDIQVIKDIIKKSGMRFKFEEKKKREKENKDETRRPPASPELLTPRPPVVTIMGHVDHGKTTLLDAIRHSSVVDSEFGGITQHIGAFSVSIGLGERITFLDTPGHAAFHTMRARGAHVTDMVVLVVAADDGVMRQTQESIRHALEANVPIIVAINKIDKAEADIERVKNELLQNGIALEELGGEVQAVPVSAIQGTNLDKLQEAILTQAELLELRADQNGLFEGAVIESSTDIGRGKLATLLVQRGTLRKGSVLVAGTAWAKVRGLFNDRGKPLTEARPGDPVEVIGWRDLPHAGQEVLQVESEHRASEVLSWRKEIVKQEQASQAAIVASKKLEEHQRLYRAAREDRLARGFRKGAIARQQRTREVVGEAEGPELAIVLKGDVDGSVEAILEIFDSYESDQCRLHLLSYGVGAVADHDVDMAAAFNGIIYAFNVSTTTSASKAARAKGVDVREHNIIYKMIDDVKDELSQKLLPEEIESEVGVANVQQTFLVTEKNKKIPVAGCRCNKGQLVRKKRFQVIRDDEIVHDGELTSLKHFKNEVETVKTDVECGMMFKDHIFMPQPGDKIICYEMQELKPELDWDLEF